MVYLMNIHGTKHLHGPIPPFVMKHATHFDRTTRSAFAVLLATGLLLGCTPEGGAEGTDDGSSSDQGSTTVEPGSTTIEPGSTTIEPGETTDTPEGSTTIEGSTTADGSTTGNAETTGDTETTDTGEACTLEVIELPGDTFYPEGITSTIDGTLYVGSIATGQIVRVTPCETEVETFVDAGTTTRNVVGMLVDDAAGLLWVCDSDATFTTPPVLQAYDLATADLVAAHDFGVVGFCNDIALGVDGSLYATDSAGARVVRVAAADRLLDTPVETWSTDPEYAVAPGEFGVNGIALADDATLYVVNYAQGELYRVPIAAGGQAGAVTLLDVGAGLATPDGVKARTAEQLLVVEGAAAAVSLIDITGDATTRTVVADGLDAPTTAAIVGADAWVVQGQLDHWLGYDPAPPTVPFTVVRVALPR